MASQADATERGPEPSRPRASGGGPTRRQLLLAAGFVAMIYLLAVTPRWYPTPDSALYLGLGRSLAAGEGYRFNGEVCNTVTPGLPVILAGLGSLFGAGFWAPNLFAALCGLAAAALVYLVISELADRRVALAVALATALSYRFYLNAHKILTDMPLAALFWAIFYACLRFYRGSRWWLVLAVTLIAVAVAVRAPGLLAVAALGAGLILDSSLHARLAKRLTVGGAVLAGAALMAGVLYLLALRAVAEPAPYLATATFHLHASALEGLRSFKEALCFLMDELGEMFISHQNAPYVGAVVSVLILVGAVRLWKRRQRLVATVLALYLIALVLTSGSQALRARYLLPVHAIIVYAAMEGLCWTVSRIPYPKGLKNVLGRCAHLLGRPFRWLARPSILRRAGARVRRSWLWVFGPFPKDRSLATLAIFAGLIVVCNSPRILRNTFYYSILSHRPNYYEVICHGEHIDIYPVAEILRRHCPPGGRVGTSLESVLHFLSGCRMVALPNVRPDSAGSADRILQYFLSDETLRLVVVDVFAADRSYLDRLNVVFDRPDVELLYRGTRCWVYRRVPEPPAGTLPATS